MIPVGNSIFLDRADQMQADKSSQNDSTSPGMRLFLDSAAPEAWARFLPLGVFRGITTNPLLLERAGERCTLENLTRLAGTAADLGAREIQMQVWGDTAEEMTACGEKLAQITTSQCGVVVKVPATEQGHLVAKRLADAGARITLTAVYKPGQALLAAGFGAAYAAPYLGRLLDAGQPGRDIVLAMNDILRSSGHGTRLLVASLRQADQVVDLARQGLDTFTFGANVATELFTAELTDQAAAQFQAAAVNMSQKSDQT